MPHELQWETDVDELDNTVWQSSTIRNNKEVWYRVTQEYAADKVTFTLKYSDIEVIRDQSELHYASFPVLQEAQQRAQDIETAHQARGLKTLAGRAFTREERRQLLNDYVTKLLISSLSDEQAASLQEIAYTISELGAAPNEIVLDGELMLYCWRVVETIRRIELPASLKM